MLPHRATSSPLPPIEHTVISSSLVLILLASWLLQVLQTKRVRPAPKAERAIASGQLPLPGTSESNLPSPLIATVPDPSADVSSAPEVSSKDLCSELEEQIRQALDIPIENWNQAKPSRGPAAFNPIELDDRQLRELIAIANRRPRHKYSPEQAWQASIILMAAAGLSNSGIMKLTGRARNTVAAWRLRFCERGIAAIIPKESVEEKQSQSIELPSQLLEQMEENQRTLIEAEGLISFLNHDLVQHAAETIASNRATDPTTIDAAEPIAVDQGREYSRRALQDQINRWAPGDVGKAIMHDGNAYTNKRVAPKLMDTTVGRIIIPRMTYRCLGVRQAIVPFDELLNLPKGLKSPLLTKYEVRQAALDPYDPARETVEHLTQARVAKGTVEKMMAKSAMDFEDFYATRQGDPATEEELLTFGVDRKGILLTKEEQLRLNLKLKETDPDEKRRSPGRPTGKKMAVVTTVHSSSRYRRNADDVMKELQRTPGTQARPPKPHNKRIWASLEKSLNEQVKSGYEEMIKRDPEKKKEWVMLMDGEMALRDQIREVFGPKLAARFTEILDFFHVLEYLWDVANAAHRKGKNKRKKAQQLVSRFARMLLEGKVRSVITLLHLMVDSKAVSKQLRKAVKDCVGYFEARIPMMRYDVFLAKGYPIASGVVEGACKNLVKCRFERCGMMWTVVGAEPVLEIRSAELNDDLDEYWQYHREREKKRLYGSKPWQAIGHSASSSSGIPVQGLC